MINNIEIKAICNDHSTIRSFLQDQSASYIGTDRQIDTYFSIEEGRLKLREGNIESNLIYYSRENIKGPKHSKVILQPVEKGSNLKSILHKSLKTLVIVDKVREIYFLENVKFHLDTVKDLGLFIEIEAIDKDGLISTEELETQCRHYLGEFKIKEDQLLSLSYSDMLLDA